MLSSLDGFVGMGHNYYLYLSPTTGRFTFMPWDLDLGFGGFAMYGTPDQMADLSLEHPHVGENKLIERLLVMPEFKANYRQQVRQLMAGAFSLEKLGKDFAEVEALAAGPIARERDALRARSEGENVGYGGGMLASLPLAEFIEKRLQSVAGQMDGSHTGYVPKMGGFGPPGGFGGSGAGRP
jgi:spore coat protein CotH